MPSVEYDGKHTP